MLCIEKNKFFQKLNLYFFLWILSWVVLHSHVSHAACSSLIQGNMVLDVRECKSVQPEVMFNSSDERFKNIRDLDSKSKARFYESYRGKWIKGDVINSTAIRSGISEEAGSLKGEKHPFFVNNAILAGGCDAVLGRRIEVSVAETCCDGGVESPCLVDASLLVKNAKVVGEAKPGVGNLARSKTKNSPEYQKALLEIQKKNYKAAVKILDPLFVSGNLDMVGRFRLGSSYRVLDECKNALPPLRRNYEEYLEKKSWADQQAIINASNFLLARCYAKLNQPGSAVMILNEYLLEPSKFRNELSLSLKHKDFGYIHTSKEYKNYKKEAEKKLIN